MPFGKHRGMALGGVPASYLLYIYDEFTNLSSDLKAYINKKRKQLEMEVAEEDAYNECDATEFDLY